MKTPLSIGQFAFMLLLLLTFVTACDDEYQDVKIVRETEATPSLNQSDSLAMVNIYKAIGPWGNIWDLSDIQTWGGVEIALDTDNNEYRIVGFNYYGEFHGTIPDDLRKLTELRKLGLGGGNLTGPIPTWIGELRHLEFLYFAYNRMNGEIPKGIGKLKKLRTLTIAHNLISGELPEELGDLESMRYLTISNTQVSGPIPESLKNLKNAKVIELEDNQLSGDFPIEVLTDKLYFGCSGNNITYVDFDIWKLPRNIGFPNLRGNRLSGEIPEWVFDTELWKSRNYYVDAQQDGYGYTNFK